MLELQYKTLAAAIVVSCTTAACSSGDNPPSNSFGQTQSCAEREAGTCTDLIDTTIAETFNESGTRVYRVKSGSQISLQSIGGDVDLFLYDNLEDFDATNPYEGSLCWSTWNFKGDQCSATTDDGEMFAVVDNYFGGSQYEISSTLSCTIEEKNQWIYNGMKDFYYFADQVPNIDPTTYDDPNELVKALRFEERDPYSNVQETESNTARLEEGIIFGLGVWLRFDDNDDLRVQFTYAESPFGQAGIKRGDIVETLNGQDMSGISNEEWSEMLGDEDNPNATTWVWVDGVTGERNTSTLTMGSFKANTVLHSEVIYHPLYPEPIGYLSFKSFYETSREELNEVFEMFTAAGISELVLDLRYNGGGRTFVAHRLAVQIAGENAAGLTANNAQHSSNYSWRNFKWNFPTEISPALNLNRVLVLTTGSTASASETVINSLRPYAEVVVIGSELTRGKPFSSYGRQFCGITLNAMQHINTNANGVSVEGGVQPTCAAEDDVTKNFGTLSGETEGMLATAIDHLVDGTCNAPSGQQLLSARSGFKPLNRESVESEFDSFSTFSE